MKLCNKCKENPRVKGHTYCKGCKKEGQRNIRRSRRRFIFEYLGKNPCVDCGENNPILLDFDHIRDKIRPVSVMVSWGCGIKKIEKEIEKCEVRCVKCHRFKTAEEQGWYNW